MKAPRPEVKRKDVVYEVPCIDCKDVYVGETGRCLRKRIMEHKAFKGQSGGGTVTTESKHLFTATTTELIETKQEYWRLRHATGREKY